MRRTASFLARTRAGVKAHLKDARVTIAAFTFVATFLCLLFAGSELPFIASARSQLASLFFAYDLTENEIFAKYQGRGGVKILIVPGHDSIDGGARYKGVYEAEYTAKIGQYLYEYLDADPNMQAILVRNKNGYTKDFADYFFRGKSAIKISTPPARERFPPLSDPGGVETGPPPVQHVRASSRTVSVLYGVNKWANENDVDIVLHLHLNDYPRSGGDMRYDGYSIYIPDGSFPNYTPSRHIAESLHGVFSRFWTPSNMRLEKNTIMEDPDLIALGSYGTLRSASVLLEYGYIYEPRFQAEILLKETAFRTYQGLLAYFKDSGKINDEFAWLTPYEWTKPISYGVLKNNDVAAFQSALVALGFYPPRGSPPLA